ncbi:MAG: InlB B-repeat-containing protein, partial [Planctomycetota bacterium]
TSDPNFDPNDPNLVRERHEDRTVTAQGGGIYSWAGPMRIEDCQITNNMAATSGGGIYLAGDEDPASVVPQEIKNCLIAVNRASRDGGGISCDWYAELTIFDCTIADNKVSRIPSYGGGLYASYRSDVEVIDSIIWGNVGNTGSQIAVASANPGHPLPSTVKVSYSDIQVFQEEPNDPNITRRLEVVDPRLLGPNTPDYFHYTTFNTGNSAFGVWGYVGDDGVDRLIHYDTNSTAYIHTVTIPEGADRHAHPANPYAPGDVAERTFTLERTFDLDLSLYDEHEFWVDVENNAIYVGANVEGIRRYVFDSDANNPVDGGPEGNYVYDTTIAPATPDRTESLAYDPDNDIWYAGGRYLTPGKVLKYDGSQGPNGSWEEAFSYTGIRAGNHHDGMAFVKGYLYLVDFVANHAYQFSTDGILMNVFYHEQLTHAVESMGWGALDHFWVGSWGDAISEFGGGLLQVGIDVIPDTPPISVEEGCTLIGWEPSDINDFMTWDVNAWDPGLGNIDADPCFVHGYYLSHIAANQLVDSPCIDVGSDLAVNLGMDVYTTRTDGVYDVADSNVDMGYHYDEGVPQYELNVTVAAGQGSVDPNWGTYNEGDLVVVTATPDPNYYVKGWYDVNDTLLGIERTLEVEMDSDRDIIVRFKLARTINVSGGGAALRNAVDEAENGDILIVAAGTYDGDIDVQGKQIKLYGFDPHDPNT